MIDKLLGIEVAKQYFINLHDVVCNQKYDGILPYSFHLEMVAKQAELFKSCITKEKEAVVFSGIWGHDSIEDARITYNDVKARFGDEVAEIIYLCTECRGRNRAERKPVNWYLELSENKEATFVKLCDITANVKYSILTNSTMFEKYKKEHYEKTMRYLYHSDFEKIFYHLNSLFKL